jgi:flagellar motor protein MotB
MAKIKITSEQYKSILLREQESRLNASGNVLNENLELGPELLEEGWKEVLLGVALLMGVGLTGINKTMAQNALKDEQTMSQIKATLEDENKTRELAKAYEEKGMKNPDTLLAKNAEKIKNKFNEVAADNKISYNVSTRVVDNLTSLDVELARGYALKKSEISSDTIKGNTTKTIVTIKDTVELELGNDNLFITGGYTLSSNGVNVITSAMDSIKDSGGRIISINVESSTDAERVLKFKTDEDPTGNIQLASLRTKSVTNLITDLDSNVTITHREIPNNGSDVVSTSQFLKVKDDKVALNALREKTSEYRYVKIKMVVEYKQELPEENPKPEDIIKKYRFELAKVFISSDKKNKVTFKNKKVSCKHHKSKHRGSVSCFTKF